MLRLLVAALLLANLLYWAVQQPPVADALGLGMNTEGREPERLQRQLRPEAIRVLPPAAAGTETAPPASAPDALVTAQASSAASAASAASTAPAVVSTALCLEAGPFGAQAAQAAVRELVQAGVASGGWMVVQRELPGRWLVYMGRYVDREAMRRKAEELAGLDIPATLVRRPAELAPGLSLGEFEAAADAAAALERLRARGARSARLVQLPSPGTEHRVRADRLPREAADKLTAAARPPATPTWRRCAPL